MKVGGDSCRISFSQVLIVDLSGIFLQRTIFWDAWVRCLGREVSRESFGQKMTDFRTHSLKPSLLLKDFPLSHAEA